MRELNAPEFALAIAISVSQHRTGLTREERARTEYIDDCLGLLDSPALNPHIRLLGRGVARLKDARRAQLCEETREIFETMAPVIRLLMLELEAEPVTSAPHSPGPSPARPRPRRDSA